MINKLLFADCYGIVNYENVTEGRLSQLRQQLDLNQGTCPALCIITVSDELDKAVNELLNRHEFDVALECIKKVAPEMLFVNDLSMGNWKLIPDPKLDKSK
jgi:hypothetical protein